MIRVGTIKNSSETLKLDGFTTIVVMTKSSKYGSLGPYVLKDDNGCILENVWQFSKIYEKVPYSKQYKSQYDRTVIWEHPEEIHVTKEGYPTNEYWNWRNKGFNNPEPVRYPVGRKDRSKCLASLYWNGTSWEYIGYLDGRKKIYWPNYYNAVIKQPDFYKLKDMLNQGKNLLIVEVDGPKDMKTILIDREVLKDKLYNLNDAFGHGYCLAASLLDINISEL